jgi:mRNA-degrading endonuclease RelE of RelBE toxin-antitoxin system
VKLRRTSSFVKDYAALPEELKKRTEKAVSALFDNPRHPSLMIKKMEGREGVWELRVSDNYSLRFRFPTMPLFSGELELMTF